MTTPTTGRFVWHELSTHNRPSAVKFYATLIGWETKDVDMGMGDPYTLCLLNGKDHAGIMKSMARADVPPHWTPYIACDDVDASTAKARKIGAKILTEPMDIPNQGRFAIVQDPVGAVFALYKTLTQYPDEPAVPPVGAFCWEEVAASDPERAAKFYADLFGYTVEEQDMGGTVGVYRVLKRGDRMAAGIMKAPQGMPGSAWLEYIAVKDVDASTRNAKEMGAKVMKEPTDIAKVGRFSVITDPTGAAISLFTGSM